MKKDRIQRQPWLPRHVRDNYRHMASYRGCSITEVYHLAIKELIEAVRAGERELGDYPRDTSQQSVAASMWLDPALLDEVKALKLGLSDAHFIYLALMRFAKQHNMDTPPFPGKP